ncbi:cell division protein [Segetibacter sp. 3557_3]|uniref:SRPBCC family protein n=1 Tax=Segetibacter sp. 3557_3 TaxID=2547429 RepID=UPI00105884CC|nr:SRPBCC family protein [Segetibacter sp. 3557_3]TDH25274.1 cell division protein [Segetibacter sp. 3557_3]
MPTIRLSTHINAPMSVVFDLSRNIDLHQRSMRHTSEKAIGGITTGLIWLNETVTWQAKHLFKLRTFTSKITAFDPYDYFEDRMVEGDFVSACHGHFFSKTPSGTLMKDVFTFTTPYGVLGQIANVLFLRRYMRNLLKTRNRVIKQYAESDKWKELLW